MLTSLKLVCLGRRRLFLWCLVFFSFVHAVLAWAVLTKSVLDQGYGFHAYLQTSFGTGVGRSGYIILLFLTVSSIFPKTILYEHTLQSIYITVFFLSWIVHLSYGQPQLYELWRVEKGWLYCCFGAMLFKIAETLFQDYYATRQSILKVIEHPGADYELQITKDRVFPSVGQVIGWVGFVNLHPFADLASMYFFAFHKLLCCDISPWLLRAPRRTNIFHSMSMV